MSQIPTQDLPPATEPPVDLGPLREQLQVDGYLETDPTFNLCPVTGCVDIVDVVQSGRRSLFCARNEADDTMYDLLVAQEIPHMERIWADSQFVQYAVPLSARPLSRILRTEHPARSGSQANMELPEVLAKTLELLENLSRSTGNLPDNLTWLKLAFSKSHGGQVLLVPPFAAAGNNSLPDVCAQLIGEATIHATPGNLHQIRKAFQT